MKVTSLDSLSFAYAVDGSHSLTATLNFRTSTFPELVLDPPTNPHRRLLNRLNGLLQNSDTVAKYQVAPASAGRLPMILRSTLPLMQGFDRIEKTGQLRCGVQILDLQGYRLSYGQPRCKLTIEYQEPQGVGWYCINDELQPSVNTHLRQALDSFYKQKTQDVMPLGRGGMAVRVCAVKEALVQLVCLDLSSIV